MDSEVIGSHDGNPPASVLNASESISIISVVYTVKNFNAGYQKIHSGIHRFDTPTKLWS